MKRKRSVAGGLRVKAYPILDRAIEEGVAAGWRRAHKHTSTPTEELICETIEREVMNAICEVFDFDVEE